MTFYDLMNSSTEPTLTVQCINHIFFGLLSHYSCILFVLTTMLYISGFVLPCLYTCMEFGSIGMTD